MNAYSSSDLFSTPWTATAPSNIAFLKYWGKKDAALQWPANDSLSMTLSHSVTTTTARKHSGSSDIFQFEDISIDSVTHPHHKVFRHLTMLRHELGVQGRLHIRSKNNFPSDCGIASSASGFAALTLSSVAALLDLGDWSELSMRGASREAMAHWARRGSGSAARSLHGGFVRWSAGATADSQKIEEVYPSDHWKLADIIVVLSEDKKQLSSSNAHMAAWGSPLFLTRLSGLPVRLGRISQAIAKKDLEALGNEIETECLEMHAVAMTGEPAVCYFVPDTALFTSWVREERARGALPAWFTIDAGPNVHLICEQKDADDVLRSVKKNWPHAKFILDGVGSGPTLSRGEEAHEK